MRPTGKLHLGNYMGALANWVRLQDQYECYFFVADWHALTTDYADPSKIAPNTMDVAAGLPGRGARSGRSVLFLQSKVLQHAELNLLLGMITPVGWLERVPSYKEQQKNLADKDLSNLRVPGLPGADGLGHPDLPAAVRARGQGPEGARGADARGGAAVQPVLQAGRPARCCRSRRCC